MLKLRKVIAFPVLVLAFLLLMIAFMISAESRHDTAGAWWNRLMDKEL